MFGATWTYECKRMTFYDGCKTLHLSLGCRTLVFVSSSGNFTRCIESRYNSICQYDVTYFDSPVYVWDLRLLCLTKLMDVRFWLTCASPQFSPETNHLKYWARLACLQLVACEFWLSTYLLSSPNDGWREVEAMMSFWWISLKTNSVGRPGLHLQRSRVKGSSAFARPALCAAIEYSWCPSICCLGVLDLKVAF